jgi:all-trans-retinol dehydrogenase (NAD+)
MTDIANKNVLVTGGASGIGRQMARRLARLGGNVIVWDIHEGNLGKVLEELRRDTGRDAHGYVCDVSSREKVYEVAGRVKAEVGPVDVLINNAGVVSGKRFLELPDEKIVKTFEVNTLALFWTCKAFLPDMIARNAGHVVTVASSAGWVGVSRLSDYSASKWAAVGFDESLRMELRQSAPGVKTTVVCPFFIDTGMFDGAKTRFPLLLPILKEEDVADRVVEAIRRNKPRVMMPPMVHAVPPLRLLPVSVFDFVADVLGVNASMEEFKGRGEQGRG